MLTYIIMNRKKKLFREKFNKNNVGLKKWTSLKIIKEIEEQMYYLKCINIIFQKYKLSSLLSKEQQI